MATNINLNYTPHKFQSYFHKFASLEHPCFFVIQVAGRQSGKTLSMEIQAIKYLFERNNMNIWMVAPSDGQAAKLYKDINDMLKGTNLVTESIKTKGQRYIKTINNSIIEFKSSAARNSLRGSSLDVVMLDEAAFMDQEVVNEVILPTLNVRGLKFVIGSTPRGKNWLYDYFTRSQELTSYRSIRYTSFDNPKASKEIINSFKETLPADTFKQEILAQFIDSGSVFKNIEDQATIKHFGINAAKQNGSQFYLGVDLAMVNDNTAFVVLNEKNDLVYFKNFRFNSANYIKNEIRALMGHFNPRMTLIESNNQGLPILKDLEEMGIKKIKGFNTNTRTKSEMINNLVNLFSKKEIEIPDAPALKRELEDFTFKYTSSGNIQFEAGTGKDDIVMALAIAQRCKNDFEFTDTESVIDSISVI